MTRGCWSRNASSSRRCLLRKLTKSLRPTWNATESTLREKQTTGSDKCIFVETAFGLGYMLSSPFSPYGGAGSFGHAGAGGSVGFADPDNGIAVGYVMNKLQQNLSGDPRTHGLIRASYDAVGAPIAFG